MTNKRKNIKSVKKNNNNDILPYYELVMSGPHTFFTCFLECIFDQVKSIDKNMNFCCFLLDNFSDLSNIYTKMDGEEVSLSSDGIPFGGLKFIKNGINGDIYIVKDGLYKFNINDNVVFSGSLNLISNDLGSKCQNITVSFAIAKDEDSVKIFMNKYRNGKRLYNIEHKSVLDCWGNTIKNFRKISWNDIIMNDFDKNEIQSDIEKFFNSKSLYKKLGITWRRGMLLVGQNGNGKSMVCRAIATSANVPVVIFQIDDQDPLYSLKRFQTIIYQNYPCIAIIEDIEVFLEQDNLRAVLFDVLNGIFSSEGVFLVATLNKTDSIETYMSVSPGMFDSLFVMSNCEETGIDSMMSKCLGNKWDNINKSDKKKICLEMSDFSLSCIQEIALRVLFSKELDGINILSIINKSIESINLMLNRKKIVLNSSKEKIGFEKIKEKQ